ncbi:hypothetical protein TWF481_009190 [Arthrobotrys musiformis]|uniref:Uncharacterized protein n=1 Tax=Arthrobotrys musiformis TaxID=47236 RepID=A0AAV9W2X5_9PEZI
MGWFRLPWKKKVVVIHETRSQDSTAMRGASPRTMLEIEKRHLERMKKDGITGSRLETQEKTVKSWVDSEQRRTNAEKAREAFQKARASRLRRHARARRMVNSISYRFRGKYVTPPELSRKEDFPPPKREKKGLFKRICAFVRPSRPSKVDTRVQGDQKPVAAAGWNEELSRQFAFPMEEAMRIRAEIEHGSTEGSTVGEVTDDDLPRERASTQAVRDGFRLYKNLNKAERVFGEKIDISAYKLATNVGPWPRPGVRAPTPPHMKPGWVMPPGDPRDPPLPDAATLNGGKKPVVAEGVPRRRRANPYEKPITRWSLPPFEAPKPAPAPPSEATPPPPPPPSQPAGGPPHSRPLGKPLQQEEFFRGRAAGNPKRATADSDALGAIETEFLRETTRPAPPTPSEVTTEEDFPGQVEFIPLNLTCSNPEEGMTLAEMLASEGLEDSPLPPAAKLIEVATKKPNLRIRGFGVSPSANKALTAGGRGGRKEGEWVEDPRNFNEVGIDMDVYQSRRLGDPYRDSGITKARFQATIDRERAAEIITQARELGQHPADTLKMVKGLRRREGPPKPKETPLQFLQRFVAAEDGDPEFFMMNAQVKGAIKQSERYEELQLKKRLEQRAREAQGLNPPVQPAAPVKITYEEPKAPQPHYSVAGGEGRPFDPANEGSGGIQIPTLSSYGPSRTGGGIEAPYMPSYLDEASQGSQDCGQIYLPSLPSFRNNRAGEIEPFHMSPSDLDEVSQGPQSFESPYMSSPYLDEVSQEPEGFEQISLPTLPSFGINRAGQIESPYMSSHLDEVSQEPQDFESHMLSSYLDEVSQEPQDFESPHHTSSPYLDEVSQEPQGFEQISLPALPSFGNNRSAEIESPDMSLYLDEAPQEPQGIEQIHLPTLSSFGNNHTGEIEAPDMPLYPDETIKESRSFDQIHLPTLPSFGANRTGEIESPDMPLYPDETIEEPQSFDQIHLPTLPSFGVNRVRSFIMPRLPELDPPDFDQIDMEEFAHLRDAAPPQTPVRQTYDEQCIPSDRFPKRDPVVDAIQDRWLRSQGLPLPEEIDHSRIHPDWYRTTPSTSVPYGIMIDDSDDDFDDEDEPPAPSRVPELVSPPPVAFGDTMDMMMFPRTCDVKQMVKPRGVGSQVPDQDEANVVPKGPVITAEGTGSALLMNAIVKVKNERASRGEDCSGLQVTSPTPEDEIFIMKFNYDVILETERLAKEAGNDVCVKAALLTAARELKVELPNTAGTRVLDLRTWLMRDYFERRASLKARRRMEAEYLLSLEQQEKEVSKKASKEEEPSESKKAPIIPESPPRPVSRSIGSQTDSQSVAPRLESRPIASRPQYRSIGSQTESQPIASRPQAQIPTSRPTSQSPGPQPRPESQVSGSGSYRQHAPASPSPQQDRETRDSPQSDSSTRALRRRSSAGSNPSSQTNDAYLHSIPEDFLRQHARVANARVLGREVHPTPTIFRRNRYRQDEIAAGTGNMVLSVGYPISAFGRHLTTDQ